MKIIVVQFDKSNKEITIKFTKRLAIGTDHSRMIQLDILRGVAILLVIFAHTTPAETSFWQFTSRCLKILLPTGVDLFFVLSGFLVGGLLFKELLTKNHLDVRRFLIRRGFRIFPSYVVFLAFVFLLLLRQNSLTDSFWALMPNFVHLQNYLGSPRNHTWSLAVEEHFYLVLPFLLLSLTVRQKSKLTSIPAVPFISIALIVLCALFRLYASAYPPSYDPFRATHLRMDALFFGVMLAYFYHFKPQRLEFATRHRTKLLCFGAVLLILFPLLVIYDQGNLIVGTIGATMVFVGYGCFLLAMIYTPNGSDWLGRGFNGFSARVVAFIGYFSYPIYLWHLDVQPLSRLFGLEMVDGLPLGLRWLRNCLVYLIAASAVGVFFGVLLEKPSLALRNRLFPARTGTSPVEQARSQPQRNAKD